MCATAHSVKNDPANLYTSSNLVLSNREVQMGQVFDLNKNVEILKKIHPKADIYFLRLAMVCGFGLLIQILYQMSTAITLLK